MFAGGHGARDRRLLKILLEKGADGNSPAAPRVHTPAASSRHEVLHEAATKRPPAARAAPITSGALSPPLRYLLSV